MAVSRAKKQEILAKLETLMKDSKSLAFIKTSKITVTEDTLLRKELREADSTVIKAKKTLIKIAFKNVFDKELDDSMLPGAVSVIMSFDDPMAGMGVASKYAKLWKKDSKMEFVSAYVEGELVGAEKATKLASIPSRETLLAKFMGSAKSPISSIVRFFDSAKTELESKGLEKAGDLISAKTEEAPESTEEAK